VAALARIHKLARLIAFTEMGRFTTMLVVTDDKCGEEYLLKVL
jgi:hypothetical protein